MILNDGRKPKDEFGKTVHEPAICVLCSKSLLGEVPGGRTWTIDKCFECGGHGMVCTKRKGIIGLDVKVPTS